MSDEEALLPGDDAASESPHVCSPYAPSEEATRFDPAWRTSTVVALAAGIVQDESFDVMPILADALEDAGCDNTILLDHCRHGTEHTTFCWALELVKPPAPPEPPVIEELSGLPQEHIEAMSRVSVPFALFLETTSMWVKDDFTLSERTRKAITIATYVLFFAVVVAVSLLMCEFVGVGWLLTVAAPCAVFLGIPFIVLMPHCLAYFVCGVKALRNRRVRRRTRVNS